MRAISSGVERKIPCAGVLIHMRNARRPSGSRTRPARRTRKASATWRGVAPCAPARSRRARAHRDFAGRGKSVMAERAVAGDGDAVRLAPGDHRMLDVALAEMVEHLVAGDAPAPATVLAAVGLVEVVGVEIAHAPGQDFAVAQQLLEGGDGLGERMRGRASAGDSNRAGRSQDAAASARRRPECRCARRCAAAPWRPETPRRGGRRSPRRPPSAAPSPYISAVSMWFMPRSSPRRSAATAARRSPSSMYQVPWPITATFRAVFPKER